MSYSTPIVSFSTAAEDHIEQWMKVGRRTQPNGAKLVAILSWAEASRCTWKDTGKTTYMGGNFGVGAIGRELVKDEPIVRLRNGLELALRLPKDLQSESSIYFDYHDGEFVIPGRPGYDVLPRPYDPSSGPWPPREQKD